MRAGGNALAQFDQLLPEVGLLMPFARRCPPMRIGKLIRRQRGSLDDRKGLLRLAMNEFCAQLNGQRQIRMVDCPDAAADTVASLEDAESFAGAGEIVRGSEARRSGTDDDR